MKPVAIFQHSKLVGPGHFASFLNARAQPWILVRVDQGESIPARSESFAGLCFLGGEMSVNDPLPWVEPELELIRDAVRRDIPVIGHCLGGQLMAKALGAEVRRNPVREIGWNVVKTIPGPSATRWLGDIEAFDSFHWHGETFSLPAGATPLLSSAHCANQAFAIGPHLGMQCHVEMTESLIHDWATNWAHDLAPADTPMASIQSASRLFADTPEKLTVMRRATERLYEQWLSEVLSRVQVS